jgi:hypothetical protein
MSYERLIELDAAAGAVLRMHPDLPRWFGVAMPTGMTDGERAAMTLYVKLTRETTDEIARLAAERPTVTPE